MAAAFAKLPSRVLWRLSKSELPDEHAIADLHLGNNTKASAPLLRYAPPLLAIAPSCKGQLETCVQLRACFNSLHTALSIGFWLTWGPQPGNSQV